MISSMRATGGRAHLVSRVGFTSALPGADNQVKQIGAALARSKGLEESVATSQLFGRLSLTLMRGNALMLASRCQEDCLLPPHVDGLM